MKKKIRRLLVAGLAGLVLVLAGAVFWIDHIARVGVEAGASYGLGVPTTLETASIGIVSGRSTLDGLRVSNPPGFAAAHILKLDHGGLGASLGTLTGDLIEVDQLSLEGIEVNLEKTATGSNFQVIADHLQRFESSADTQTPASSGRRFIIHEAVIRNVKVHVRFAPLGAALATFTVPIDELRLREIGSESDRGVLIAGLSGALLECIMRATLDVESGLLPAELKTELASTLQRLTCLKSLGATLAVNVNGTLHELTAGIAHATEELQNQARGAVVNVQESVRSKSQELHNEAQKALQGAAGELGTLLQPKDRPPSP